MTWHCAQTNTQALSFMQIYTLTHTEHAKHTHTLYENQTYFKTYAGHKCTQSLTQIAPPPAVHRAGY